ncbi:hypothetical protein VTL71DRAFT_15259 [Oculimacula yallundae]|uniref:Uncharacterized protein n=1 Tax=Oculimacula yallundae TaxID=86028 RepID=A0ABR4CG21_9HELO
MQSSQSRSSTAASALTTGTTDLTGLDWENWEVQCAANPQPGISYGTDGTSSELQHRVLESGPGTSLVAVAASLASAYRPVDSFRRQILALPWPLKMPWQMDRSVCARIGEERSACSEHGALHTSPSPHLTQSASIGPIDRFQTLCESV